jgi:hypothetical protein
VSDGTVLSLRAARNAKRLGDARRHRTVVHAGVKLRRLTLGHTLPLGSEVDEVPLDGRTVHRPILRETNPGLEVLARVRGATAGRHVLVVRTAT